MVEDVRRGIGAIGGSAIGDVDNIDAASIGGVLLCLRNRICRIGAYPIGVSLLYGGDAYCVYTAIGRFDTFYG